MEVIAKRKNSLLWLYGGIAVLGLFMLVIGWNAAVEETLPGQPMDITPIVPGIILTLVGAIITALALLTPSKPICYDGQYLIFPKGEKYSVRQIKRINYKRAHAKYRQYKWGKLIIEIGDRKYKFNYIADVEGVQNRLIELLTASGVSVQEQ